jgi:hypothetical protein
MSQMFEYKCDLAGAVGAVGGEVLCSAWSHNDPPILAVASQNGQVSFFLEEGERLPDASLVRLNSKCISLAWHPKLQLLASGWDDGTHVLRC